MTNSSSWWFSWIPFSTTSTKPPKEPVVEAPFKSSHLAIHIPDVPEHIWKNPYYPLAGPPQSPQEAALLQERISQESQLVNDGLHAFGGKEGILSRIAKDNCADLVFETASCIRNLRFYQFLEFCGEKQEAMNQCIAIQKRNLESLGYSVATPYTLEERQRMIREADRMYLQEMESGKARASS